MPTIEETKKHDSDVKNIMDLYRIHEKFPSMDIDEIVDRLAYCRACFFMHGNVCVKNSDVWSCGIV